MPTYGIKIGFPIGLLRPGQAGLSGLELTNHSYQVDRSAFSVVEAHQKSLSAMSKQKPYVP